MWFDILARHVISNKGCEPPPFRSGQIVHALEGHNDDIIGVDFSHGGTLLATGSDDATCRVWDTRTWETIAVLSDHAVRNEVW